MPLSEADRWLDHFSSCSPCFQEFTQFRKQAADRRRTQVWLAVAAVVLLAAVGWLWVSSRSSTQTTATVVLDLRERSVARGNNPSGPDQSPLKIPRSAKQVVIDLPIGSKEGSYDLALLNAAGDEVSRASGTAKLENQIVILRADIDIANVHAGSYVLTMHPAGLEGSLYPVRVI